MSSIQITEMARDRLKRLLRSGDLSSLWQAGREVNAITGGRAGYRLHAHTDLVSALAGVTNERGLYRCRRLAVWPEEHVKLAERKKLSLRAIDELLKLDRQPMWKSALRTRRQRLILAFPGSRDDAALRRWQDRVRGKAPGRRKAQQVRDVCDARRYVVHRLHAARIRLEAVRRAVPKKRGSALSSTIGQLKGLERTIASELAKIEKAMMST